MKRQELLTSLLVDAKTAARMLSMSRSKFYSLRDSGRLGPQAIFIDSRPRFSVAELQEWVTVGCPKREEWSRRNNGDGKDGKQAVAERP